MASINTDINLNIKSRGGARAAKDVNAAQQALRKLGDASQNTDKEAVKLSRNTTRLGQVSASAGRQFSSQAAGLGGLVGAYAGAAATVFALQQAFSALNRAAQVEQLIAGTNTLAAKVGENGSKIIKSLQEITEGQLTLADASEKANLALSSGFSTKQIEDLGKVATKVSKALGRNLGDAFERLVRGATKLEPELLDELGIFTKIDPATRKYSQSIGKAVSELSEFERRQAFVNAIIEEGTRKFNDLDTSAPNAQKSLNTLAVTLQNLGTQFGILLANYLSPVADFFANSLAGAISIFGLVATQISRTAFTQLIQGSDALAAKFEEQRIAFLSNAKQTEKSRKALTDFNQTMMAVPRITTVFRGGDAIENTAKQLFALGQAGKISAANINDFQEAMVKQAQLATEAANKYQAAQDKLLAKQAKGGITRADQRALADYSLLLSNAQRDQLRFAQAASIATAAVKAQSAALTLGAKAWRVFGAAISFAGKAASVVFRAFNLLLLALSIGPLILEIVGKIDIFNKAIEKLKDMFISAKNAAEDTALGMSALANSLDSGAIITKYEDIGIAAKRSQQIQLEALDDIANILQSRDPFERLFASGEEGAKKTSVALGALGGAAVAVGAATLGIVSTVSLPFIAMGAAIGGALVGLDELIATTLGTEPIFRGALTWITSWFISAESETEATSRAITDLQQRIVDLNAEFAKTGNRELLVLIDTYKLFIDQVNSSTVAQQQFIGAIARLTGQNANLIQDLLGDSFTEIGPVLDGVQLGIKGIGNSIEQLSGVAAQGLDTFIGFQAVLLQTERANNSGATSAAEYIDQIQALRTAQANLGNTLKENERRIETTKSIIEDLNNTIATTTDSAVVNGLTLQVEKLQKELEILQNNTDAMSASFDRNKDKVNDLSASYDILNEQVARNNAIIKAFDSAARSISNFDLTGIINPESGAIAANSTEALANQITVLRSELEKLSNMQSELDRLQRSLLSATDTATVAQLTNKINTLKKLIVNSDSRREFLNNAIAGSQLNQVQNLQNMNKQLDDIIRKQQQQNTLTAMQNNIDLMQATEAGAQIAFELQKKLLELDIEHRKIQGEIAKERIATEQVVAERSVLVEQALKEQARLQSDIRKEKINGLIQELQYHKDILAITQKSMDSGYNLFDENTNNLFKALSKLGEIGLNNDLANQEERLKLEEIRVMEEQMSHDWAIVDARAQLLKKEAELLEQEKVARLAEIQNRKELAALEAAEAMRRLSAQKSILEEQVKLDLQRIAFEKENQAKDNKDKATEAAALLTALQNNPDALRAEIGDTAFATLQDSLDSLRDKVAILSGKIEPLNSASTIKEQLDQGVEGVGVTIGSQVTSEIEKVSSAVTQAATAITTSGDNFGATVTAAANAVAGALQSATPPASSSVKEAPIEAKIAEQKVANIDAQIAGQDAVKAAIFKNILAEEALAAQRNQTADEQINNLNTERANMQTNAALERELGAERVNNIKAAIEQEKKKSRLQALQDLSNTFVEIGGALNALILDDKEKRLDKARSAYTDALSAQESALESVNSVIDSYIDLTDKMKEVLEERRELEMDIAKVIGSGVNGAKEYYKLQKDYINSIETTISQGNDLRGIGTDKALAEVELARAESTLAMTTQELEGATEALDKAKKSLFGRLANGITVVGQFTNSIISLLGVVKGVGSIKDNIGTIFSDGFKGLGDLFEEALGTQTRKLNEATYDAADMSSLSQESFLNKYSSMTSGDVARPGELDGSRLLDTLGAAAAGAFAVGLANSEASIGEIIGTAVGTALGKYVTPIIGNVLGNVLGGLGNFIAPIIGGFLGNLLGNWLGDLFAPTKTSTGTADFATGGVSSSGEQSAFVGGIAEFGVSINSALESVTKLETGLSSLTAVLSTKGSKLKAAYVSAGGYNEGFDPEDSKSIEKAVFKVIALSFRDANAANKDIQDAMAKIDFGASVQQNLEKLQFAAMFDDIVRNIELATNNYSDLGSYIEDLTKRLSLSINEYTNGAVENFEQLRQKTEDVFGPTSTQLDRLLESQVNYLLEYAGLYEDAAGNIQIVQDFTKNVNNMALVIATVTAQTMAFKDALIGAGKSAQQAEDALQQGVELKLRAIFDQFEDSLDSALAVGAGIDAGVIPKFQEILQYQKDIVKDAVVIQETLAGYGTVVGKTEELVYRQRAEMIAEASYVELIALRNLTAAGSEFSNVMVKAGVDAEIARRKIESMFEGLIQMADLMQSTAQTMRARNALRFAQGGPIPKGAGAPNKDSVPAMLMPGEFVVNKQAAENIGLEALNAINNQEVSKFATGGSVQSTLGTQLMTNAPTSYIGGDLLNVYTLPTNMLSAFQKFGQDTDLVLSFKEASEIINQANYELFDTYKNLLAATGASGGFNAAMKSVYDALKEGDIILAQARFSLATSLISATTEQEAYNKVIADTRANQVLNTAGINKALDGVDNLTDSLNEFYFNAQTSSTTYADLSKVTSELNLLLGKEVITSDEYSNALNSVLKAYEDSLIKIQEYTEFFLDLQDLDISATGIIQDVREIEYAFLDGTSYILQAVKDGFIDTLEATSAQQRLQTALNRQRIDLLKQASEEELIVLKNTNSDIVDIVIKTGAITELVARRLDAVAEAYGSFESRLVSVFNSTLTSTERFTNQVVASIESTIKEAGIALDSSTPTAFLGTLATFLQEARNGTVDLGDLSKALGELNYQLSVSEEIDTETYKTGVNILASSFERFANYANDLNLAFIEAQDALKIFGIEIKSQFKELGDSLRADIEGIVNIYKTTFNDLKSVYETAVGNQASAEEELYNSLFAAQQAFASAGGNLEGHTQRISDIVNGLDPQYMGYPGILAYLDQLSLDIQAGVAQLGEVDTKTSLSVLQANLTKELANLSALQTLPDSADKFVKISRSLSAITSLEEQISAGTAAAGSKLADAGLQLVKVEQELNKNNLDATKRDVDLTLTDITEDLVLRAQNAREEYNKTNEILDGYNTALANSTNFTQGLADATVSAADAIFEFNNSLGQLEDQWAVVQTAVSDLTSNNLTNALVNIRNENDQYAISLVSASEDINLAYTTLTDRISEYLDVEAALNSWNSLYSTVIDTSEKLPSAEFQELSDNFEKIKLVVTDVAANIGGSVNTFGEDLQNFLLNAIAILESPITISPPAVAGLATAIGQAATVASGNLVTTTTTGNTYYGTDLTNELLYRILQELQNGLSVSSQSSTGVSTTSSYTPGSIPNLFDTANLSSLTGQLFSVEEPLTRPADFFYIVAPMIVGPEYFFSVKPGETVWTDWFEVRPDWTWWWQWFDIQREESDYLTFFDLKTTAVKAWEFFNKDPVETNLLQWVDIIKIDADYRTFFNLVSATITTTDLFALTGKQNTDFWYWFNDPSRRDTNFYEWFTKISLDDVYYYNFFTLRKNEVMFWDWFDISDKIPITQLIEDTPIKFDEFFYIQTRGTEWNDWFNDTQLMDVDYSFFFIVDQVAVKWTDFFMPTTVDAADFIVPGNKYNGDEFFDIKPSVIYGAEIYSIGDPLLLPGESFVNIDNTRKLQFGVEDIFNSELIGKRSLTLTDVFSNWDVIDGWDITNKAVVSVWDLFDKQAYDNNGLAQKINLKTKDIFSNITYDPAMFDPAQIGVPAIEFEDKYSLEVSDLFLEPTRITQSFSTWYFDPTKHSSSFWDWFKAPTESSKVALTDFLDAAPVTDLLLLVGEPMEVTARDIFKLSAKQEDLSEVTADRLYNIIPIDLNFGDVINPGPYKLEAHHVIDFDHLYENKYVAQAADVIDIRASVVGGNAFWDVIESVEGGSYFWSVIASDKAGSAFFNVVNASSVDGEDVFTPKPTSLPGAAFFSVGVRKIVDANDLLEIGTPAKIEVTGVFESEFADHLRKIQELIDNVKYLLLDTHWLSFIADDMHNNAYNTAFQIYDLFEKAHHDLIFDRLKIISNHTGYLPLIHEYAVHLSSISEVLSEYQPYLIELENLKYKTEKMVEHLYEIEYNTKLLTTYNKEMVYLLTQISDYMLGVMDVRLANIEASTNNTYAVNNLWLPIIAGPQNVQDPLIGATVFDLLLDELEKHTTILNNIDTNTNNTFMLLGGLSLGTILSGGNVATTSNGIKLDHISDNLDHLSTNLDHISDNLDHLSDNLDTVVSKLDTSLSYLLDLSNDLDHLSNDSDHLSGNLDHISNDLDHLSTNLDHISDNLDHLSDNLDTVVARLNSLLKVNATRYIYPSYSTVSVPYKEGGLVQGPGTGTSDSIPARLSNGEFVLTANTVADLGTDFLNVLNSTGSISDAVSSLGIRGDNQLAHINSSEAELLKAIGGSGTRNSRSGLKQFFFDGYNPLIAIAQAAYNTGANIVASTSQSEAYNPERINSNSSWNVANFSPNTFAKKALVYAAQYIAASRNNKVFTLQEAANAIGSLWYEFDSPNRVQFNTGSSFNNSSPSYSDYSKIVSRLANLYPAFADGGFVSGPGTGTSDSMLARLSDGEYIFRNSSVDNLGVSTLDYMNKTGELPKGDTNVEINITNNGQPVDVEGEPEVKFIDGKVVVDIVLKDLRTNGPIKKTIKKIK